MEIRTLASQERLEFADLLDEWRLAEGWTAGDRFRYQVEYDPTWSDENVLVAVEQDRLLGGVSLLPRQVRVLGHSIPTGGISNLFTSARLRGRGIATDLLERAAETLRARGFELAIVFPGRPPATPDYFEKRGFVGWSGQQSILRVDPEASLRGAVTDRGDITLEPVASENERALQSIKAIHAAYAASRSGTVVRDDALWQACFHLSPAPFEEFWLARRGGLAVAYGRAAILDDVLTATEVGRFEDGADGLAALIAHLLEPRGEDPLLRGAIASRITSRELRSFLVLPTFDDIGLTVALEHRGIRSHPMDDARASVRCINLTALASRLDVELLPGEDGPGFLRRILPPDGMVYWPSDRF
ncbi:MAG: GNAT family N-acetyltransferase [Myxococcota bacterium]